MTKKELSQLYHLNREITKEKERLTQLESAAMGTTTNITGLPHAQGITNKTALAAEIADCKAIIEAKIALSVVEYNHLSHYIASVQDSLIRQILSLKYVEGLSWEQVAGQIGGYNSINSLEMMVLRHLRRN